MTDLIDALDSIASSLLSIGHPGVRHLRPPLPTTKRMSLWSGLPFVASPELDELYSWRDGTNAPEGALLDELHFVPGFFFMSLEEAIRVYFERESAPQWKPGWFPFMADGAGDFYIAAGDASTTGRSTVVGFIHGEPDQPVEYESITAMMQTFSDAYAKKAVFADADGCLDYDDEGFRLIAQRFNPNLSLWQS